MVNNNYSYNNIMDEVKSQSYFLNILKITKYNRFLNL